MGDNERLYVVAGDLARLRIALEIIREISTKTGIVSEDEKGEAYDIIHDWVDRHFNYFADDSDEDDD